MDDGEWGRSMNTCTIMHICIHNAACMAGVIQELWFDLSFLDHAHELAFRSICMRKFSVCE